MQPRQQNQLTLPPSSIWMGSMPAFAQMLMPVSPPVKLMALHSLCVVRKSPISEPLPAGPADSAGVPRRGVCVHACALQAQTCRRQELQQGGCCQ